MIIKIEVSLRIIFFSIASFLSLNLCGQDNISASGNWLSASIWSTSSLPLSTDAVGWPAGNTTVTFPQAGSYGSSGTGYSATVASMTMNNNSTLNIGQGDGNTDHLTISGDFTDGNSSVINIASDGILEIDGNFNINNGLTLNVSSGGILIVNGTVNIANSATLTMAGTVTISGNFDIGNSGQVNVPAGGVVSVSGSVSSGNATCANLVGSFTAGGGCTSSGGGSCPGSTQLCAAILPITLKSFAGSAEGQVVNLNWSTASEINFDHFVLERSSNGTQFAELASVKGSGSTSMQKNYSYTDNDPFIGNSYYRLTSIDFDGYTEVFNNNIVRVTVKAEKNFYVAPNPIVGFNLKGNVNFDAATSQVAVYDRMGALVGRYAISGSEFELQLQGVSNGIYFAQIQSGDFTKTVRFVVNQESSCARQ